MLTAAAAVVTPRQTHRVEMVRIRRRKRKWVLILYMSGQTPTPERPDAGAKEETPQAGTAASPAGGQPVEPTPHNETSTTSTVAPAASEPTSDAGSHATPRGANGPADPSPPNVGEPTLEPSTSNDALTAPPATQSAPSSEQAPPQHKSRLRRWISSKPHQFVITTVVAAVAALVGSIPGYVALFRDPPPVPTTPSNTNIFLPTINGAEGQTAPAIQKGCEETLDNRPGWGPARPTVAGPTTLTWPSLNADRENPNYGDERNFFTIKDADNKQAGGWSNDINDVQIGKRYLVRMLIHNSGSDDDFTVARDAKIKVSLPNCTSRRISSTGFLTSSTAFPSTVWSGVTLSSATSFALTYVPDTARLFTNANPNPGIQVPGTDFLSEIGQMVGYDKLDGAVRGGYQQSSIFVFTIEAVHPA